jgi:hypothetical protein
MEENWQITQLDQVIDNLLNTTNNNNKIGKEKSGNGRWIMPWKAQKQRRIESERKPINKKESIGYMKKIMGEDGGSEI